MLRDPYGTSQGRICDGSFLGGIYLQSAQARMVLMNCVGCTCPVHSLSEDTQRDNNPSVEVPSWNSLKQFVTIANKVCMFFSSQAKSTACYSNFLYHPPCQGSQISQRIGISQWQQVCIPSCQYWLLLINPKPIKSCESFSFGFLYLWNVFKVYSCSAMYPHCCLFHCLLSLTTILLENLQRGK